MLSMIEMDSFGKDTAIYLQDKVFFIKSSNFFIIINSPFFVSPGEIHQTRGFQTTAILQLYPPAAITCCVLQADWGLVAAGTAHGLALFDYLKQKPVIVKCTLNPNDLTGAGDAPISRRKSFKKSLRESFRRLRKGRSQRRANAAAANNPSQTPASAASPPQRKLPTEESQNFNPLEAKPVERQIEARPVDDAMGSIVRCLYFARTFLINGIFYFLNYNFKNK